MISFKYIFLVALTAVKKLIFIMVNCFNLQQGSYSDYVIQSWSKCLTFGFTFQNYSCLWRFLRRWPSIPVLAWTDWVLHSCIQYPEKWAIAVPSGPTRGKCFESVNIFRFYVPSSEYFVQCCISICYTKWSNCFTSGILCSSFLRTTYGLSQILQENN